MVRLALLFVLVAVLAGVFGFGLVADTRSAVARVICIIALVLAILALIVSYRRLPLD